MFFTIVTVTYNAESTIRGTLESILEQTCTDYEYIIVDGKSDDGTLKIIEEYKNRFDGKLKIISEVDNGVYDAMNKAIAIMEGKYAYFLGGDDRLVDNKVLEDLKRELLGNNASILYGNIITSNQNNERLIEYGKIYRLTMLNMVRQKLVCHQAVVVKAQLYIKHPFDLRFKINSDQAFYVYWMKKGIKPIYFNRTIARFSTSGLSGSNVHTERGFDEALLLTKEISKFLWLLEIPLVWVLKLIYVK